MLEAPDCCTASPPTDCADLWVQLVGEDDQRRRSPTPPARHSRGSSQPQPIATIPNYP